MNQKRLVASFLETEIFYIKEIAELILNKCDVESDYKNILFVNKYFYNCIYGNSLLSEWLQLVEFKNELKFIEACKHNFLLVVKHFVTMKKINIHTLNNSAFRTSCKNGSLDVIKYLIKKKYHRESQNEKQLININRNFKLGFILSYKYGHIQTTKYIINICKGLPYIPINIYMRNNEALSYFCKYGHLDMVKDMIENKTDIYYQFIDINAHNDMIFVDSCGSGNLKLVKYLINLGNKPQYNPININAHNNQAFINSCKQGHLEIAQYLLNLGANTTATSPYGPININDNDYAAFRYSCINGQLKMVEYLVELSVKSPHQKINIAIHENIVFKKCCDNGYLDIIQYLLKIIGNEKSIVVDYTFSNLPLRGQGSSYYTDIPELNTSINTYLYGKNMFINSCSKGHLNIVKFLNEHIMIQAKKYPLINLKIIISAFEICCDKGYCDIIKYLIESCIGQLRNLVLDTIMKKICYLFTTSCKNGYLDLVKYLIEICELYKKSKCINVYPNYNFGLRKSCEKGHLQIVKYIINIRTDIIISWPFIVCCTNNRLNIAKYLINISNKPGREPISEQLIKKYYLPRINV